jgi:hypothetical protein
MSDERPEAVNEASPTDECGEDGRPTRMNEDGSDE